MENKIIEVLQDDDVLFIFSDIPTLLTEQLKEKYNNETAKIHLWYEEPDLINFTFMYWRYECTRLWFDKDYDSLEKTKEHIIRLMNWTVPID